MEGHRTQLFNNVDHSWYNPQEHSINHKLQRYQNVVWCNWENGEDAGHMDRASEHAFTWTDHWKEREKASVCVCVCVGGGVPPQAHRIP
jgi:hypothetical protein